MSRNIFCTIIIVLLVFYALNVNAKFLDLSSWSADTYNVKEEGFPEYGTGKWILSANKTTVTQKSNADPSIFINNVNLKSYRINGTFQVTDNAHDNDLIGFVFGYQNDHQFYLFDWKRETQNYNESIAYEGFRVIKIKAINRSNFTFSDFWGANTENSSILASNFGDNGWDVNTKYFFHLDYYPEKFTIIVYTSDKMTELWNVTIHDNEYSSGQFGFYCFSQENVEYSDFELGNINPETKDSDNDGVIDQWDSCPKTPENSCVNNKGCSCELSIIDEKGSVEKGKWKTYYANVDNTYSNFTVKVQNLTNDVDLYVKKDSKPDFDNFDCRPYKGGTRDEVCDLTNNNDNLWYFSIFGYQTGDFTITVKAKR